MRAIMFQGTGSDVGKSLIVAGLARALANRGLRVRPFKPQNMSNNAAVTMDGGEIGRAQALQARAARVEPSVHMNPVLLKPQSEIGAQVVVQGRVLGNAAARDYQMMKAGLMVPVLDSFAKLCRDADVVLVEGAGSASEINLRDGDIANFGFAQAVGVPVVIIGDIDRGGVIASIVGTKSVIAPGDAALVAGFLINRFRGDPALFEDGLAAIARSSGWEALGVVPHFDRAGDLPAEDALGLRLSGREAGSGATIVVLAYPRISNFDDFDPLRLESGVTFQMLQPGQPIPGDASLVILPGSKATIADLAALRATGWHIDLAAHVRRGGLVLGICGGYQMLGRRISDPGGVEGEVSSVEGLGLLDVETELTGNKTLREAGGRTTSDAIPFNGYEMHVGRTFGPGTANAMVRFSDGRGDGAIDGGGRIAGCYVHGLFGHDLQRRAWLARLGASASGLAYEAHIDETLDALAAHLECHVSIDRMLEIACAPRVTGLR